MLKTGKSDVIVRRRVKIRRVLSDDNSLDQEKQRKHRLQKDFLQAVRSNNPGKIRDMLNQIRETSSTFPLKTLCNALYLAIEKGSLDISKLLADPCSKHVDLSDVILVCARHGRVDIADFLFQNGYCKNVNYLMTKNAHEKNYPLMEALQNEQGEMVMWLLKNNANVHVVDLGGNSILHLSAAVGNGHGIAASIVQGVKMKLENNAKETAIELAESEEAILVFLESAILRANPDFQPSPLTRGCILTTKLKKRKIDYNRSPFTVKLDHTSCVGEFFWLCVALVGTDDELFDTDQEEDTRDRVRNTRYHIYPSYRLRPLERLYFLSIVLSEIMKGPSKPPFKSNILLESVFLVIFEVAAQYLGNQQDHILAQKLFDAFEEIYNIKLADLGVRNATQYWPRLYRPMIDLVCKYFFGETYWEKLELFRSNDAWRRDQRLEELGPSYFVTKIPSYLAPDELVYRLETISRFAFENIHLEIAIDDPGPGFANIFSHLEEASDYQRRHEHITQKYNAEQCLESLQLRSKSELGKFWMSLSSKDKWSIVEMNLAEMQAIITSTAHWEIMRASMISYINFAWETDLLEIYEHQIIIDEKLNETRDIEVLITESLESMTIPCKRKNGKGKKYEIDLHILRRIVGIEPSYLREFPEGTSFLPQADAPLWEQKGRRMLENLVLCEITRKVALEYLRQREQSRMRAEALEQEIELLNDINDSNNKPPAKKKKKRRKKKKKQTESEPIAGEKDESSTIKKQDESAPSEPKSTKDEPTDAPRDAAPKDPTQIQPSETKEGRKNEKKADISSEYNHSNPFSMLTNSGKKREQKKPETRPKVEKTVKKKNRKKSKKNKKKKKEANKEKKNDIAATTKSSEATPSPPPSEFSVVEPINYQMKYKKALVMPCKDEFDSVMQMQLIGLPKPYLRLVKSLEPNTTALFLFNMAAKMLYGIYEPIMDTNGWCIQGSHGGGAYPTQLKFKCVEAFQPIPRKFFAKVFSNHDRPQRLTQTQMLDLVDIFRNRQPLKKPKRKMSSTLKQFSQPPKPPLANRNKRAWITQPQPVQNTVPNEPEHREEFFEIERSSQSKSPQTPVSSSCGGPVITEFGLDDASGVSSSVGRASQDSDPAEDRERIPPLIPEQNIFSGIESVLKDSTNLQSSAKLPETALDAIYGFAEGESLSNSGTTSPVSIWPSSKKQRGNRPGTRTFSDEVSSQSSHEFEKRSYSPPKRFKASNDVNKDDEPYLIMSGLTTKSVSVSLEDATQFRERRKDSNESDRSVEPLHLFGLHQTWDVWGNNPGGKGWSSPNTTKDSGGSPPVGASFLSSFEKAPDPTIWHSPPSYGIWDDRKAGFDSFRG